MRALRDIEQSKATPQAETVQRMAVALRLHPQDRDRLVAVGGSLPASAATLKVGVLGPLVVPRGDRLIALNSPMLRWLLGLLAVQPHRPVSRDEIVDTLWGETPPRTCLASIHVYIGRLRTLLGPIGKAGQ